MRPSEILEKHRVEIREIAKRYESEGIRNLRVCGSVAKGTDSEKSDIDFIIDVDPDVGLFEIGGIYQELSDLLKCDIDLAISSGLHPIIKQEILREVIYI